MPKPSDRFGWRVAPPLLALALALATMWLGWHGVDWPAQLYRVHLFRVHGWIGFDTGWYGGNSPIAYSTLFPPFAATLGVRLAVLTCVGLAAVSFDRLASHRFGTAARVGSLCFAAGMVVQVAIGQLSFLLGMALGLVALLVLVGGRPAIASILGVACAFASFVAALFLVLAAVSWCLTSDPGARTTRAVLAGAAALPVLVVAAAYHQSGTFPFPATTFAAVLVVCVGMLLTVPTEERTLRLGVVFFAIGSAVLFVIPTPIGANVGRLATTMTIPLLLCAGRGRVLRGALVVFVLLWQLGPALGVIGIDRRDPSTSRAYYAPLLAKLAQLDRAPARLEIPMTREHWEAAWVAPKVPLARGWERQLDITRNTLFYRPGRLTPAAYRSWLDANGVGWVALPSAPLDYSADAEATLLRAGAPYLELVWQQHDWKLWRVQGSPGLVTGPADLLDLDADGFTLRARVPGDSIVRVRYSPTWSIADADGGSCLGSTHSSWTVVRARRPGPIRVVSGLLPNGASTC